MPTREKSLDIFARTIYGEAEHGDVVDAKAIAAVIMNRVGWKNWPDTVTGVCLQPKQFSCWNDNNPRRDVILEVEEAGDAWFGQCIDIAAQAMNHTLEDITQGSTHYYASYLDDQGRKPHWSRGKTPAFVSSNGRYTHYFYNDIDTPAPESAAESLDQERPLSSSRTVKGGQIAAAGGTVSIMGAAVEQFAPTFPLLQSALQFAPWVVGCVVIVGAGWAVWARVDDRSKGIR